MVDVGTRVEADAVLRDLKAAHYAIPNALREALRSAAEDAGLPAIRSLAPSFGRPLLVARSTMTRAYITTRGSKKMDRALGLLNYGGTVTGRIEPRRTGRQRGLDALSAAVPSAKVGRTSGARALKLPWGPRAAVSKPRTYTGQFFLGRGVEASLPAVIETFEDKALAIYSERGWSTEKGGPGG